MRIIFRVDASSVIGSGHFIRCLTLAGALRDAGAICHFICRAHDGALAELARSTGFMATVLPLRPVADGDTYAGWIGAPWQEDAVETRDVIGAEKADWVIVDHYGLDARWERDVRASCRHLMVIDDLANRPHDCDLLLDQNLVEGLERRYAGLVPETCGLLLGTTFALLQPSYAELRDRTPSREYPIRRLLIYFGGADQFDLTSSALRAVLALDRRDLAIDVVINPQSPFAPVQRELARHHPQVTLHERLNSLAGLLMKADAALGAAGTSSWERCCLGLPTLLVTLADNQRPIAAELDRLKLARWLGDAGVVTVADIAASVERLLEDRNLDHWSRRAADQVDGLGTARVAAYVMLRAPTALATRFATTADEPLILQWANDPLARQHAFAPEAIAAETHHRWFRARLRDPENCHFLVVTDSAGIIPIGQVRFDRREAGWEISYMLDSRCRGRGLGAALLATALERFAQLEPGAGCFGRVKADNMASRRIFDRLDFACQDDGKVLTYYLTSTNDQMPCQEAGTDKRRRRTAVEQWNAALTFTIAGRPIGTDHPPFIIAELSANHNGSLDRALETIEMAQRCGADAIKLQTYTPDTMTIDVDSSDFLIKGGLWDGYRLYDLYKEAHTPYDWHRAMFEHARKIGITVFSTPFDETAVDLLEEMNAPAYKIASFEMTDLPLVRYIARTGKPIIMSTGMASEDEIAESVAAARDAGCRDLVLLHCISSYPSPVDQSHLRQLPELGRRFGVVPGLSDHTRGTTVSVAAVALGAAVIEKHFTLSRNDKGPDSDFSLEPDELRCLCTDAKDAWSALGRAGFDRKPAEQANRIFRRSIYFVRDLPAGSVISKDDIRRIRPGNGLPPKYFDDLIGRRVKQDIRRGDATSWELLKD